MRINDNTMRSISENYGWCSSWAVWAAEGEKPKSNIGDLTIFDFAAHPDIRKVLHSDYVAVGLNVSGGREFPIFIHLIRVDRITSLDTRFVTRRCGGVT